MERPPRSGAPDRLQPEIGQASNPSFEAACRYHEGTKHHFHRFAASLGYLDWASQPHPFRSYAGAATFGLWPDPSAAAADYAPTPRAYHDLFNTPPDAAPVTAGALGDLLRHSLGLSAWKAFKGTRWSLRVNPSSGNLHPTEAYLVCGAAAGLADVPALYHYAPDRHAIEQRGAFDAAAWREVCEGRADVTLVALTSIHWREAWKYGERAFRYCQHDLGHALAAISLAASLAGWRATALAGWSQTQIADLAGLSRAEDFFEAEPEEPGCLVAISAGPPPSRLNEAPDTLLAALRQGRWSGRASQLSEDHVDWTLIDEAAAATRTTGGAERGAAPALVARAIGAAPVRDERFAADQPAARQLLLRRRSAVAFDGRSSIDRSTFAAMLERTMPAAGPPWGTLWWEPCVHLALFVHRVEGVVPGLYLLERNPRHHDELRSALRADFLWERAGLPVPLWCLERGDCRALSARLSCDQSIASDGFFSLGMLARFDDSLRERGAPFYRQLFWETGVVGQVLYLEAELAGTRATGIGCFYDDPVHQLLGLEGRRFQSLYHFTVGRPIEDTRLTTEPGYDWERAGVR